MFYICARHGESETNSTGIISGPEINPNLTPSGIAQSEGLASRISSFPIKRIIASSSNRTVQSAQIVNGLLKVKLTTVDEYRERDFGVHIGKPLPKDLKELYESNEGMETFVQMSTRFLRMPPIKEGDLYMGHSIATPLYLDYVYRRQMGKNFIRFGNCEYQIFEI